jgi:hypothetical protein
MRAEHIAQHIIEMKIKWRFKEYEKKIKKNKKSTYITVETVLKKFVLLKF